jgi:hypothetical protein
MKTILLLACPWCETPTAELVRAGIFNDEFLYNVAITLSPFPLLVLVVALVYFGFPVDRPKKNHRALGVRGVNHDQREQ